MTINFIPNDPLAGQPPTRQQSAQPERPDSKAGFLFGPHAPEAAYPVETPDFLFWQAREGALAAIEAWESLNGSLKEWARAPGNKRKLAFHEDAGDDLNAGYNGIALQFYHHTTGTKTTRTGASVDVVAHETGHACLDALCPDLWDFTLTEIASFHESFGDCLALITAINDPQVRAAMLQQSPDLTQPNFVEAEQEDLADGVRREYGSAHPASLPRRACNNFQWQLPTTLPTTGGPSDLTSEVHSFSRVFTGCFYDVIRLIFAGAAVQDADSLLTATQTAAKLLIAGAKASPASRFFREVGRTMVQADKVQNGGANGTIIGKSFQRHGIALGSNAIVSPQFALAGPAPKITAKAAVLSAAARRDILERVEAPKGAKLDVQAVEIGGERVIRAVHRREVDLTGLSKALKGVVAVAPVATTVGTSGGAAAVLGAMPDVASTVDETRAFVAMLLEHGRIEGVPGSKAVRKAKTSRKKKPAPLPPHTTHAIKVEKKKKKLARTGFMCGAARW